MIKNEPYGVEPWSLTESSLDLDLIAQSESVFALSNGHIGLRGNLDEGEPHGLPGTYLNSVYEDRPLPYAEAGYGFPDMGQTVINVTNGKIIRLLVNDEPFDIRYGTVRSHTRTLDLRAGTLTREVVWTSPAGHTVKVTSVRLVSLTQRAIAAISYSVTPVTLPDESSAEQPADSPGGEPLRLVVLSEIVANEDIPVAAADPRAAAMLAQPLVSEEHVAMDGERPRAVLVHGTRSSKLRLAAGMAHEVTGPKRMALSMESFPDLGRLTVAAEVPRGEELRLVKYLGYGWSSAAVQARAGRPGGGRAGRRGADRLGRAARRSSARSSTPSGRAPTSRSTVTWRSSRPSGSGSSTSCRPGARAEQRPIPAKGLTGTGYDGHTFWDTEAFVLPVLTYTHPSAAADALRWRCHDRRHRRASTRQSSASRARRSPGGRSTARNAPATGRPARPPSTSTPTSPPPS